MNVEYRPLTADDIEQAVHLESTAFYNQPTPQRVERMRAVLRPAWTLGAFIDGRLVADIRTLPRARRINGKAIPLGAVGPVACLAEFRRQGHVGRLLRLALERMREQAIPLSGLYTPHDALYNRFGWERAEGKKRLLVPPKDVTLRLSGEPGAIEAIAPDDWPRLEAVYRQYAGPRNGPLHRVAPIWRQIVLRDQFAGKDRDAIVWRDSAGQDQGYVVYASRDVPTHQVFPERQLLVREFVALSGDAYLGLWRHLLTHDLALRILIDVAPDDPFPHLATDPWKVQVERTEGAMIRIVDVERALGLRPYCGQRPLSFTLRIADKTAPWNDGVWRVEAGDGRMSAERTDGDPDLELSVNTLAPVFTGYLRPEVAHRVGLLTVHREEALEGLAGAFAVTHPPFCLDYY